MIKLSAAGECSVHTMCPLIRISLSPLSPPPTQGHVFREEDAIQWVFKCLAAPTTHAHTDVHKQHADANSAIPLFFFLKKKKNNPVLEQKKKNPTSATDTSLPPRHAILRSGKPKTLLATSMYMSLSGTLF